jgi:hypothetical protein
LWLSRSRTAVQLLVWSAALVAIVATNVVTARKIGVFDLHVQDPAIGSPPPSSVTMRPSPSSSLPRSTQVR